MLNFNVCVSVCVCGGGGGGGARGYFYVVVLNAISSNSKLTQNHFLAKQTKF